MSLVTLLTILNMAAAVPIQSETPATCQGNLASIKARQRRVRRFELGGPVRFRADDGTMRVGRLLAISPTIRVQDGSELIDLTADRIFFAPTAGEPYSPKFLYWWAVTHVRRSEPVIRFLNDGARDFDLPASSLGARVRRTMRFVTSRIKYDEQAMRQWNMDEVLRTGTGVCLHMSFLTAAILLEAAVPARLVIMSPPNAVGHIWLEANFGSADSPKWFVLDPANGMVESISDLVRGGGPYGWWFTKDWYLNPERRYLDPQ